MSGANVWWQSTEMQGQPFVSLDTNLIHYSSQMQLSRPARPCVAASSEVGQSFQSSSTHLQRCCPLTQRSVWDKKGHLWSVRWTPVPTCWLYQRSSCPDLLSGACSSPWEHRLRLDRSTEVSYASVCEHSHDVLHTLGLDEDSDGMELSQLESFDGVSWDIQDTVFTLNKRTRMWLQLHHDWVRNKRGLVQHLAICGILSFWLGPTALKWRAQ